jgi:hypothetical protein
MNFDSASMERGEFCHDRYMGLLLVDYTQRQGAQSNRMQSKAVGNAKTRGTSIVLKCGV